MQRNICMGFAMGLWLCACGGEPDAPVIVETCGGEGTQVHVVHPEDGKPVPGQGYQVHGPGFGVASRAGHPEPYPGQRRVKPKPEPIGAPLPYNAPGNQKPEAQAEGGGQSPVGLPGSEVREQSDEVDARNLEEAKKNMKAAYQRFKEALEPAADYVSERTRKAYYDGMRSLAKAFENLSEAEAQEAGQGAAVEDSKPKSKPAPPAPAPAPAGK